MPEQPSLTDILSNPLHQPAHRAVPAASPVNKAAPARTLPPALQTQRFIFSGGQKPSAGQWKGMIDFFKLNPALRFKPGMPHPDADRPSVYFLSYHPAYPGGERWGTKQQLADHRKRALAAQKRWRKKAMETDPAFRTKRLAGLQVMVVKWQDRIESDGEKKADAKRQAARRAQKSRRRRVRKTAPGSVSPNTLKKQARAVQLGKAAVLVATSHAV